MHANRPGQPLDIDSKQDSFCTGTVTSIRPVGDVQNGEPWAAAFLPPRPQQSLIVTPRPGAAGGVPGVGYSRNTLPSSRTATPRTQAEEEVKRRRGEGEIFPRAAPPICSTGGRELPAVVAVHNGVFGLIPMRRGVA